MNLNQSRGYVDPHNIKSVEVTEADIPRVIADSKIMLKLCFRKDQYSGGGLAVAHQQITRKPLRFFVLKEGVTIINPVITEKKNKTKSMEGCLSFPLKAHKLVKRYNDITIEYRKLVDGRMSNIKRVEEISGQIAFVFQHEIDHMDCKYIYKR